jgi:NitT/TauT family transport system ATP-binding protein
MLQVKDLTRVYGRADAAHVAIEGVEFQVAEGELVSIVGPSGCGKSTVLRCIAGLLAPTSGQVVLRGEPVEHVPDRLAVMFQEYGRSLYPWLTVRTTWPCRCAGPDPVLLLMDEPFGSVDAQTREDLEDLVLRVRQERTITILRRADGQPACRPGPDHHQRAPRVRPPPH